MILVHHKSIQFKGSRDPSHFSFEINGGKSRIRHTTTLKLNDELLDRLKIDCHSNSESFYVGCVFYPTWI